MMTPPPPPPELSAFGRLFDRAAMGSFPWVARALGYTYRVGRSPALERDGHAVLAAVWAAKGVRPPASLARVGARYDEASTWIVAYHRGAPVGVMALLDLRVASIGLDCARREVPAGLDLARTRELGRLAIVPGHRGGAQTVMVGLLREMLTWCRAHGVALLLSASVPKLFAVYARFNPTARLIDPPERPTEPPEIAAYFAPVRAYGGLGVLYTFEVAGASPWSVFSRYLRGRLRGARKGAA